MVGLSAVGFDGGFNLYAYVGGNPLRYTDPFGLWPFGLPGKSQAQAQGPGQLQKLVPDLTSQEAKQVSNDAIDKLGWSDVSTIKSVTPDIMHTPPPDNLKDLNSGQVEFLKKFLDELPARDEDAVKKIKARCP